MTEWFERWFGEEYLALYPHRDVHEAERVVDLLERLDVVGKGTVLDLACGAGRHLAALARRGARVLGLDLSLPMLRAARRLGQSHLVRGDLRQLPVRTATCDTVLNLFTSFGYFDDDRQHVQVLAEVARVLKPGAWFVLDFLNPPFVRATLVPRDERRIGGSGIVQERRLSEDGRYVIKTIRASGEGRSFIERVRLFERDELVSLLTARGLTVTTALGDYDGGPYAANSPRCILVARR